MDFAEPCGHVGIQARDKGNAGGTTEPGRADARDREAEEESKGRDDPGGVDAFGHCADGLNDALENADIVFADGDEEREGDTEIEGAGEKAAPGDGTGESLARVFDFVAHDGGELEAHEAEANDAERIED